jgi:hypothetical protein
MVVLMAARLRSRRTKRFKEMQTALPAEIQRQAEAAYALFRVDPSYSSLHFKRLEDSQPPRYGVRIGAHYRAVGYLEGDLVTWFWIGSHEAFNKAFAENKRRHHG